MKGFLQLKYIEHKHSLSNTIFENSLTLNIIHMVRQHFGNCKREWKHRTRSSSLIIGTKCYYQIMCILISYVKEDDIVCHKPKRLQERTNLSILENSLPLNMYTMLDLSKTYKVNVFPRMFYLFDEIELVNKSRQTTYVHKVTVGNIYQVNHISEES